MKEFLIHKDKTIKDAFTKISAVLGIGLVVVDEDNKLLGTLTDGDIRRAISSGLNLDASISDIMFKKPTTATKNTTQREFDAITRGNRIKLIPILDGDKVIDVYTLKADEMEDIPVVLMAGGLGSRLGDLTKDTPKPMLEVAGKPVLERIIQNFTRVGFKNFYISVNYKAHMIEDYFKDGSDFDCEIIYLRETKRLGTAGSLSLLPKELTGPMIVTNGDLLTLVDYRALMNFHESHPANISMCTRKFELQVPYGVVNSTDGIVVSMEEKPTHDFNVNAGVYVIDASLLKSITPNEYLDMPSFVERCMQDAPVHCFPMVEAWIDIGKVSDLELARTLYGESHD